MILLIVIFSAVGWIHTICVWIIRIVGVGMKCIQIVYGPMVTLEANST